jgi:diketogulonate reductase-like aldo/keto reductase
VTPEHIEENSYVAKFENDVSLKEEDIKQLDALNCNQHFVQPKFYKFPDVEEDVDSIPELLSNSIERNVKEHDQK